jgi:hypothetical protein
MYCYGIQSPSNLGYYRAVPPRSPSNLGYFRPSQALYATPRRLRGIGQDDGSLDPTSLAIGAGVVLAGVFLFWGGRKTRSAYKTHRRRRIRSKISRLQAAL